MGSDRDPGLVFDERGNPRSRRFDDVYFQADAGPAESRHVFLQGCQLPDHWCGRPRYVIGETGFGSGLNFLVTWALWRETRKPGQRLHYVSVERYPLRRDQLAQIHALWPDLAPLSQALRHGSLSSVPGYQRIHLADDVTLTLMIGDALHQYSQLEARVDAWFLDGFAPSRNPDMWQPRLLQQIARLSANGARLATFTAAGQVRRDLEAAGFEVQRGPGFGAKRERLTACFRGQPVSGCPPWFQLGTTSADAANTELSSNAIVAIIGAGVAGHWTASALRRRGIHSRVFDSGAGASRVPSASVMPRLEAGDGARGRFLWQAYQYAVRAWSAFHGWRPCGALELATSESLVSRLPRIAAHWADAAGQVDAVDARQASAHAGISLACGGLHFSGAGVVQGFVPAPTQSGQVEGLRASEAGWRVLADGAETACDAVVLCTGASAPLLAGLPDLQFWHGRSLRWAATAQSRPLRCALHGSGYFLPSDVDASDAAGHWAGASFRREAASEARDRQEIAEKLSRALPAALLQGQITDSWGGVRCAVADRLPLAGPLPDLPRSLQALDWMRHGRPVPGRDRGTCWQPDAWTIMALGARGFTTAPLLGEWLASMMTGDPWPMPRDLALAVASSRFLARQLKRHHDRGESC